MNNDTLITDELRSWIGRESEPVTGEPVLARDIRRFASAIGDPDLVYHDEKAAKKKYGGVVAPPCYVLWALSRAEDDVPPERLQHDGRPSQTWFLPPVPLERIIRGGDVFEFHDPIYAGDAITLKSRIVDIYERTGRSGKMIFVVKDNTYTNHRGELVAKQQATLIFR